MMSEGQPVYKRILLKLSGEALRGELALSPAQNVRTRTFLLIGRTRAKATKTKTAAPIGRPLLARFLDFISRHLSIRWLFLQ